MLKKAVRQNVYVILVAYNGIRWLPGSLSYLKQRNFLSKTIIVDNCSGDGIISYLESNFPAVHLIKIPLISDLDRQTMRASNTH